MISSCPSKAKIKERINEQFIRAIQDVEESQKCKGYKKIVVNVENNPTPHKPLNLNRFLPLQSYPVWIYSEGSRPILLGNITPYPGICSDLEELAKGPIETEFENVYIYTQRNLTEMIENFENQGLLTDIFSSCTVI
ncbi:MAG: hypothetical protein VX777_03690 [Chlamydiota bacterium]|nr:hypothetical protein [Chlamydiota bacterium]